MSEIVPRYEWGALPPKRVTLLDPSRVERVFLHHTTGTQQPDIPAWLRSIQRFHQQGRGWSDIAYSWLVSYDGRIWEGRGARVVGAHTKGWNSRGYAIAYLGDGGSLPPQAALDAISYVRGYAETIAGRTLPLFGHRDVGRTACPGDALYGWISTLTDQPAVPERVSPVPDLREGYRRMLDRMRSRRI